MMPDPAVLLDLAGLLATAALLATLVALEVRRSGAEAKQPVRPRLLGLTASRRVVGVMWVVYLLLFLPRVLGLLT